MSQPNLTSETARLMRELEEANKSNVYPAETTKIHISELTSLPAFAYEKLRNFVDYKDEFLLRKNAIKRFLKRKFLLPQFSHNTPAAAQALIRELILSRYLPNDQIPESKVAALTAILTKYYLLFTNLARHKSTVPNWREQILGLAAVECDHQLVSPAERNAYTSYAYAALKDILQLPPDEAANEPADVLLILNIQRTLERADNDISSYYLLVHYHPDWFNSAPDLAAANLANNLDEILLNFNKLLNNKLGKRLIPKVKRLLVPIVILQDIIRSNSGSWREVLTNSARLEHEARATYQKLWKNSRKRLRRKGFHAIIYIFLTKMILALLLEIPYERIVLEAINYTSVIINLMVPPVLMALITVLIKSPSRDNENRVVLGVKELVQGDAGDFYRLQTLKPIKAGLVKKLAYGFLYIITITASFGGVGYFLWRLHFNIISAAIFFFFISLVSFFGISLRQQARQLKVAADKETIVAFLLDFFSLPVVAFGKWLSTTFDKVNIFVFMLDFLFEIPFKSFLKVLEDWFQFLKDKKEEIY
ncbi:MAG: hypothetical protein HY973_02655 [Candidatus Kerfeldbacteria bacterium]|nr:hypothetical protein [Candidatus Kerfeldbacteria bacterium]